MYKKGPTTGPKTIRSAKTADGFIKKSGNISLTKLPKGGCPSMPRKTKRSPVYSGGY